MTWQHKHKNQALLLPYICAVSDKLTCLSYKKEATPQNFIYSFDIYIDCSSKHGEKGNYVGCFHLPPCGGIRRYVLKRNSSSSSAGIRACEFSSRLSLLPRCWRATKNKLCKIMLQ
ncbi:hypothetical protein OIU77_029401 [Salix suchowensis]|uniref:Uncharacterized protein n=1 Tax=Salix suchowensis TaxID=1278906 RepID=A0ABQ9BAI9_9ROSI|nr:hypothetical protein OIU77_029401 [Salix suchowensis]